MKAKYTLITSWIVDKDTTFATKWYGIHISEPEIYKWIRTQSKHYYFLGSYNTAHIHEQLYTLLSLKYA